MDDMATVGYRLNRVEADQQDVRRDVGRIGRENEALELRVAVHDEQISGAGGLVNAMNGLGKKVDSLNKALYTFAGSFIAAAIVIAIAISGH